ncbi:MAG: glycosyltransferase [Deltaproteobacteria bacterium]|nr:glycosyltransferase [Deltaproteobacteria bacterium]
MRVLWLASSFPRRVEDAAGAFLGPLACWLAQRVDLAVATPRSPIRSDAFTWGARRVDVPYAPARIERLFFGNGAPQALRTRPWTALLAPGAVVALAQCVRRMRPDVVMAHWLLPAGLAAALARAADGPPWMAYAHGTDARWLAHLPAAADLFRGAETVAAPSASLAAELQRALARKIDVLPLPVQRGATRAPVDHRDVGFLGRLLPQKGVDVLIHACAAGKRSLLVGGDGPERARLARLARARGVDARFLGAVPPGDRGRFFASVRVLAVPSVQPEGAPAVIAEAWAHGLPVVGSAVPGILDVLPPASCTPAGNAKALSDMLRLALHDGKWRRAAVRAARDGAAARAPAVAGPRFLHLLEQAAARGWRRP